MKSERSFVAELEQKAREQRKLAETELVPGWAKGLGNWLAVHPWRVILPLAVMIYGLWRMVNGSGVREFILGLFGGFAR